MPHKLKRILSIVMPVCLSAAGILTAMPSLHGHCHHRVSTQQVLNYFHLKLAKTSKQQPADSNEGDDHCTICRALSSFMFEPSPIFVPPAFVHVSIPYLHDPYQKPFIVLVRNFLISRAPPASF